MSTKKEDEIQRQQLIKERLKEEALARAAEEARLEEEKRKAAALLEDDTLNEQPADEFNPVTFQAGAIESDDWKKIIEDFQAKYPGVSVADNVLRFPSMDEALSFFTEQATMEPPRKFLASEIGPDGTPTGLNVFSCGDGTLYKGTFQEIHEQLEAAQLENPDDPNIKQGLLTIAKHLSPANPAQSYKESLLKSKGPEADASEHHTPSPLGMTPTKS